MINWHDFVWFYSPHHGVKKIQANGDGFFLTLRRDVLWRNLVAFDWGPMVGRAHLLTFVWANEVN